MYCMAVVFTELASETMQKGGSSMIQQHWGSIFQSTLSLYMGITGGDDWRNFVDPFKDDSAQYVLTTAVFAIYIAFATLVMLNLVTGVFVEGAQRIIKEDRDHEISTHVRKLFYFADEDHSGDISFGEFEEAMEL